MPPSEPPVENYSAANESQPLNGHHTRSQKNTQELEKEDSWADPGSKDWDVIRFLSASKSILHKDHLGQVPHGNLKNPYIDGKGKLKNSADYMVNIPTDSGNHPKLEQHIKNGTATRRLQLYYKGIPHNINLPIAGVKKGTNERKMSRRETTEDRRRNRRQVRHGCKKTQPNA